MNVLITSVGAKVLLVKGFSAALKKYGGLVFTSDTSKHTAGSFFGERHFVLPPTTNRREFVIELQNICKTNDISLVIPTRDGELELMADIKDYFKSIGIHILVASQNTIKTCINKRLFSAFLRENGFSPIPELVDLNVPPPYFVRPVYGSAGLGSKMINSQDEAKLFMNDDFLLHPFIDEDEYSIDLLMDLSGNKAIQAVCRQRKCIVGGESKISSVVDIGDITDSCIRIGELLHLVGHNVLQVFYSQSLGPIIIEANARFGGASNLSICAGLNSIERIIKLFIGDESAYDNGKIKIGMSMYRYSEDVFFK